MSAMLDTEDRADTTRRIESACKVWSAGVSASPLGIQIAEQAGAEVDRAGRVKVLPDLTVAGHPNVFIIGDMAAVAPGVPHRIQKQDDHCHFVDGNFPHDDQKSAHHHRAAGPHSTARVAAHPTRFSGQGRVTRLGERK